MINQAQIKKFKGIKHCVIKNLNKVNLFIGKNNCGKSNILEAVYLGCKEYVQPELTNIIQRRSGRSSGRELFYNYEIDKTIKILFDCATIPLGLNIKRRGMYYIDTKVLTSPSGWTQRNRYNLGNGSVANR